MVLFSFLILVILAVVITYFILKHRNENGSLNVNENELVKKFNKVVKRITERNIEDVKADLFRILDKYKFVKCEQFIENRTQIKSARSYVEEQINATTKAEADVVAQLRRLKNSENPDVVLGAQLLYQSDSMKAIIEKLKVAKENLLKKECEFDREIDMFNSKFALKKAEVSMMIANAISLKNVSSIDIKLEDLVSEFQTKVEEQENADYVRGKIYGTEVQNADSSFNLEEYKQKFVDFQ